MTLLGALAAIAACADAPVAPAALAPRAQPAFEAGDGNPPPPPADGIEGPGGGGGTGCVPLPGSPICPPPPPPSVLTFFVSGVQATVFANRPGTNAFISFSSTNPNIVVSPDARVHETDKGLVGRGTITVPISSYTGVSGSVGVIDLSTVTGWIMPLTPTGAQSAFLRADLTYPDGSDILLSGGTTWLRYAVLSYLY
ncbi:hypothetical protein [Roseisolibacter agri]|uniref:hypothetical protein n=1 Tax=Roseisolibacter agri TaxID=2014610 RepID=UPI0024E192DC|nr:hypothetical protein [Roseisolibacter agri]